MINHIIDKNKEYLILYIQLQHTFCKVEDNWEIADRVEKQNRRRQLVTFAK